MDVSTLPFNQLIGLRLSSPDNNSLVYLPDDPKYGNHLGTVHGSALLAVAEAASGAFLGRQFNEHAGFIPVVRKLEAKFRKPASGQVSARCNIAPAETSQWCDELTARGRLSLAIPVEVIDGAGVVVLSALVEWFITRKTPADSKNLNP